MTGLALVPRDRIERQVIFVLAGQTAERRATGTRYTDRWDQDNQVIDWLVDEGLDGAPFDPIRDRTEDLVENHWLAIVAVAAALNTHKRLGRKTVANLVAGDPPRKGR